ncbi:MAG TPA: UdgX family uracil-DNA binding protein [Jiangellaceae bacterium]|nr:UdgX family uracil-DNA binding protein [Jiangellaceae bacterium]
MTKARGADEFVPAEADLPTLKRAAASCRGCELYKNASQTVFGDGDQHARIMLVGEMPGDREDREGRPFVGPAGRLLAKALAEAEIDRSNAYVTNVVKHFKFTERGKRRIHQTPTRTEVVACRPWLVAELDLLEPEVLVCLGATAAKAIFGPSFRLTRHRGELLPAPELDGTPWAENEGVRVVATVHPSAVLRTRNDRAAMYAEMVEDLRVAASALR